MRPDVPVDPAAKPDPAAPKVTIVGAGLVGSLLSVFLARRGQRVEVFERLPDPRQQVLSAGRSINLAISERGLHALRLVGLEAAALRHAIPMEGRLVHGPAGELVFQGYGKDASQCIHSISRATLNELLLTAADATGLVELHFGERLATVDWDARLLAFDSAGQAGGARAVPFDTLIGADGAGSALRALLQQRTPLNLTSELLGHGYKELSLSAGVGGRFQLEKHALHIWPRGSFMLIALPNADGSFTCTLFLPFEAPAGEVSFNTLDTPEKIGVFFAQAFPDVARLMPDLAAQFRQNPTGHMGTVRVSPWHLQVEGAQALLIGDAAHAILPFYGQGMNCGFEDCEILSGLLERAAPQVAFEVFSRTRKTDAEAIGEMAVDNFREMSERTADAQFLLQKQVERRLLNAFPGEFLSQYSLVSFSRTPYRVAHRLGEIARAIVEELSAGLGCAEDVNLVEAGRLIRERLTPYAAEHLPSQAPAAAPKR